MERKITFDESVLSVSMQGLSGKSSYLPNQIRGFPYLCSKGKASLTYSLFVLNFSDCVCKKGADVKGFRFLGL